MLHRSGIQAGVNIAMDASATQLPPQASRHDQPLGTSVLLRYGIGQLGAQVFRDTLAVLLPLFLTTMLRVQPWLVGAWSDRLRGKFGRTPFLVIGGRL